MKFSVAQSKAKPKTAYESQLNEASASKRERVAENQEDNVFAQEPKKAKTDDTELFRDLLKKKIAQSKTAQKPATKKETPKKTELDKHFEDDIGEEEIDDAAFLN